MSDSEKQKMKLNSRRQLLKTTILGTGAVVAGKSLPEQWSRPLVESVTLPAHAQTSLISITGGLLLSIEEASLDDSILDTLVPTAHAEDSAATGVVCFDLNIDGSVDVRALITYSTYIPEGPPQAPCDIEDVAYFTGTVTQGNETELTLVNGECAFPNTKAGVLVNIDAGVATGYFVYVNDFLEAGTEFSLDDPGCSITDIPEVCDQGTCLDEE